MIHIHTYKYILGSIVIVFFNHFQEKTINKYSYSPRKAEKINVVMVLAQIDK